MIIEVLGRNFLRSFSRVNTFFLAVKAMTSLHSRWTYGPF
jgi:hypothetical protein